MHASESVKDDIPKSQNWLCLAPESLEIALQVTDQPVQIGSLSSNLLFRPREDRVRHSSSINELSPEERSFDDRR
jgi:hypothetical protein